MKNDHLIAIFSAGKYIIRTVLQQLAYLEPLHVYLMQLCHHRCHHPLLPQPELPEYILQVPHHLT